MEMCVWDLWLRNGVAQEIEIVVGTKESYGEAVRRAVYQFYNNRAGYKATDSYDVELYKTEFIPDIDCLTYTFYVHKRDD